ncbi:MAG: hypothetical protein U0264_01850 [Candidatus Kapaibacterium sp.]
MKNILTFSRRIIPIMAIMLLSVYGAWGQQSKKTDVGSGQPKAASSCPNFNVTATLQSDALGCHWLVTYTNAFCDANTNTSGSLYMYPHGIRVEVGPNTTQITNFTSTSPWLTTTPTVQTVVNPQRRQWTRNPYLLQNQLHPCNPTPSNVIPSGTSHQFKVYITPLPGIQTITVSELSPNEDNSGNFMVDPVTGNGIFGTGCQKTFTVTLNQPTATIVPLQSSICSGGATEIRLVPPMPPPARIQWYSYTPPNCGGSCPPPPATYPPAPGSQWSLVPTTTTTPQYGANQVATNKLFAPTCYVAHIDSGCFSYYSNVVRVNVCPALNGVITPLPGSDALSPTNHACKSWSGGLKMNYETLCCATKIQWYLNGQPLAQQSPSPWNVLNINHSYNPNQCCTEYKYTAVISNECGEQSVSFNIIIDRPLSANDVTLKGSEADFPETVPTATPTLATLCYNRSAKIWVTRTCSLAAPCEGINILKWQQHNPSNPFTNGTPTFQWADIPGATGTERYNTNKLNNPDCGVRSVWYRVQVSNGTCPPIWSNPFEIKVKPELKVTLTPPSGQLCTNSPITLTAITCPPANTLPSNAFKWFKDGVLLSGSGSSRIVNQAGNYSVIVSDVSCSSSKTSNTVKICGRPVVSITGPCGICSGQSIILKANNLTVPDGCTTLCNTYIWKRNGIVISPQPVPSNQLTVTQPGVYTVELDCGACKSSATHTVTNCPPSTPASCQCEPIPNRTIRFKAQIDGQTRQDSCGGNVKLPRSQEIIDVQAAFGCMNPQNGACATTYEWYVNGILIPSATGSSFNTTGTSAQTLFNTVGSSFTVRVVIKCNGVVCTDCTVKVYII